MKLRQWLTADLDHLVAPHLVGDPLPHAHRALQTLVEACVYLWLAEGAHHRNPALLELAGRAVTALEAQQAPDGLFTTGDNVLSPPDSAFTVNGLARCLRLVRDLDVDDAALAELTERVQGLLARIAEALRTGGVHTPNHRWEMACALAQLHDLLGDPALLERAEQWLAEGIDIQADGLYSERSPNYAVHVSNPCLLVLAELLDRPDLREIVHRNLHAHALLTDDRGLIETIQSRRQDQHERFNIGAFAGHYRRFALLDGCTECAAMAELAEPLGGANPVEGMCEVLRDGRLGEAIEAPARERSERGWTILEETGLAIWQGNSARLVARTAPDVAQLGRVASGISANPTLCTFEAPGLRLDGLRLSREFFNLGPVRATQMSVGPNAVTLVEHVEAHYYHPLAPEDRRADGRYLLEFEGRFAAAMDFAQRERDTVGLDTTLRLVPAEDHLVLELEVHGPAVPMAWAFTGSDGITLERRDESGHWRRCPDDAGASYHPGEAYRFLGGTDAPADMGGHAFMTPGRSIWRIVGPRSE